MPYVTTLLLAAPTVAAQSLRVAESPEELDRRARADSNDPAAHYNAALGWWSRNRYDRADSALERALALDPSFAAAWLARAIVQARNESFARRLWRGGVEAVREEQRRRDQYYQRAFLLDPFLDVGVMGSIWYRGWSDLGRGIQHLMEGHYEESYHWMERVLREEATRGMDSVPPFTLWMHHLAAARANHLPEAIADMEALLRQSLARESDDSVRAIPLRTNEYRYMLAALRHRNGETAEALRLYREVLEHDISNYVAHVQMARIFEATGQAEAAIVARRRAMEANPDDHTLVLDLGTTLARAGRWDEAEQALAPLATPAQRDFRVFYRLGIVRQQLGKRDDARQTLERFLVLAPSRFAPAIADAQRRLESLR